MQIIMETRWVNDWISARAESPNTAASYRRKIRFFANFCADHYNKDFHSVVCDWRQAKKDGNTEREQFLEDWRDVVISFHTHIKGKYASLSIATILTVVRSFFDFWEIPIRVHLPKRAYVTYHNKDLTREHIKQILAHASPRDRVMWLILAESGMRVSSLINMKYWQIREDFERRKVPMRIILPSSSLKDHVGDRWTFIGQDGYRELSQYLKRRLPLDDDDYVFVSEKQHLVKGEQFSVGSLSAKFGNLVKKLGLAKGEHGKPRKYRQHGLRKYFRNNMRAETGFRKFWMGHSLGVDEHYLTRDVERHRKEYAKAYDSLRIFKVDIPESINQLGQHYEGELEKLRSQLIRSQQDNIRILEEQQKMLKEHREEIEEIKAQNELVLKYVSDILLKEEGIDLKKKLEQAKQIET